MTGIDLMAIPLFPLRPGSTFLSTHQNREYAFMTSVVNHADHRPTSTPQKPNSRKRPPRRATRAEAIPAIRDRSSFVAAHRTADVLLHEYLAYPRNGYVRLPYLTSVELDRSMNLALYANNCTSRITFADIVSHHLEEHQGLQTGPIFQVTLAVSEHVVPSARAADFDIRRVQALARQSLSDIPFIGMVEGAFYRNWGQGRPERGDFISWHTHCLTWGASKKALENAAAELVRSKTGIILEKSPIYIKAVSPGQAVRAALYSLKGQMKEYRVYSKPGDSIDLTTGEIISGRYCQTKRLLRTGDRARLCDVFRDRLLDKMLFGNGEGTELVRSIRREALQPFRVWEARQARYRA
jgi:hypothetical protein